MEISSNVAQLNLNSAKQNIASEENKGVIKDLYTEQLSSDEAKEIREQIRDNANAIMFKSTSIQADLSVSDNFKKDYDDFQSFLKDIGYDGKPIAELSQDEASELVSEDGFFGVEKTAQRIADFVIKGATGKEDMLKAGREGVLKGFDDAQQIWGSEELPDISQKTMKKAIELIDKAIQDAGFSVLDQEA